MSSQGISYFETIKELERSLHSVETRNNPVKLEILLHPDFIEIGYSGNTFDKSTIAKDVLSEKMLDYTIWSQDFKFIYLSSELIQVCYLEAREDQKGEFTRFAKRTSIWHKTDHQWQIRYHQGTPTSAFIKS